MKITKLFQKVNNQILEIDIPSIEDLDKRYLKLNETIEIAQNKTIVRRDKRSNITVDPSEVNYNNIYQVYDNNNQLLSQIYTNYNTTGGSSIVLDTYSRKNDGSVSRNYLTVNCDRDNRGYVTFPHPRGLYNGDGVTYQSMVNYAPKKILSNKDFYVGGTNASDTLDLYNGRGESPEKPFATIAACTKYITTNFFGPFFITINLQADFALGNLVIDAPNFKGILIKSASADNIKTLAITSNQYGCITGSGVLRFSDLNIEARNCNALFWATEGGTNGCCYISLSSGLNITGSMLSTNNSVVAASSGGTVRIESTITGDITGKRYFCTNGGRILTGGKGPNAIPGTEAGTCDENSIYA